MGAWLHGMAEGLEQGSERWSLKTSNAGKDCSDSLTMQDIFLERTF